MNQELIDAEEKSIAEITEKMLAACDSRLIAHGIAAALSTAGNLIAQSPQHAAPFAASLRKLADHVEANANAIH